VGQHGTGARVVVLGARSTHESNVHCAPLDTPASAIVSYVALIHPSDSPSAWRDSPSEGSIPLLQLMVGQSGTRFSNRGLLHSRVCAAWCTPMSFKMKAIFFFNLLDRALVELATSIDRAVERYDLGFFYQPRSSRGWAHFEVFRDEVSWTAWVGKFELVWDRPRLAGAQQ